MGRMQDERLGGTPPGGRPLAARLHEDTTGAKDGVKPKIRAYANMAPHEPVSFGVLLQQVRSRPGFGEKWCAVPLEMSPTSPTLPFRIAAHGRRSSALHSYATRAQMPRQPAANLHLMQQARVARPWPPVAHFQSEQPLTHHVPTVLRNIANPRPIPHAQLPRVPYSPPLYSTARQTPSASLRARPHPERRCGPGLAIVQHGE